jgi:tetratricopeptide (TPR) repeat protein
MNYKEDKEYDKAAELYQKLAEKETDLIKKSRFYENAGMMFKFFNPIKAINCFITSAKIKSKNNFFISAGEMWEMAGNIYEKTNNLDKAIIMKARAIDCYSFEQQKISYFKLKVEIIKLLVEIKDYKKAITVADEVINEYIKNPSLHFIVNKLIFYNLLYYFITQSSEIVQKKFDEYSLKHPLFNGTKESRLIIEIIVAHEDNDINLFSKVIKNYYNNLEPDLINDVKTKLFS